ncbi:MAG: metal ABC transporter ATP-binding protein [Candidatus Thalassarchaeaceae archaeon]|jgi:zinc transport system ATP-binding protein|nr:metal ABC transporter ATP-binding protein [Candidatus Thalassarchaeaceae archaeon]
MIQHFDDSIEDSIILKIENLSVYRSGKLVIKDIDMTINRGEFVGLVGPNGSGKSTLLLAILGVLKSQKGSIEIYNQQPMSRKLYGRIGWVSQAAANLPKHVKITVRELVQLGTVNLNNLLSRITEERRIRVDEAIKMVGLEDVQHIDISRLSGGQRQRAVIARALATQAEFILLDEPLVGIDRDSRNDLLKLLDQLCHEKEKTILMVSHDLTAIRQTAHRMIFLEETIQFDGVTEDFPNLTGLADLRGIHAVHDQTHYHGKAHSMEDE